MSFAEIISLPFANINLFDGKLNYFKVKPLLEVTSSEQAIAMKEAELKNLRETLLEKEHALLDYTIRIEQVCFFFEIGNSNSRLAAFFGAINITLLRGF